MGRPPPSWRDPFIVRCRLHGCRLITGRLHVVRSKFCHPLRSSAWRVLGHRLMYHPQDYYEQTFSYQAQPNTSQWTTTYSLSPNHAYTTAQHDSMMTSTSVDPYSPSFSPPTSPTDSPRPYSTTPVDKNSSQTAVCRPSKPPHPRK